MHPRLTERIGAPIVEEKSWSIRYSMPKWEGYGANPKRGDVARDRIELPTRGFSVLLLYRDYVTLSVAIGIYSSV